MLIGIKNYLIDCVVTPWYLLGPSCSSCKSALHIWNNTPPQSLLTERSKEIRWKIADQMENSRDNPNFKKIVNINQEAGFWCTIIQSNEQKSPKSKLPNWPKYQSGSWVLMHYCPNDQTQIYAVSGVNFFVPTPSVILSIRYHFIHRFIHKWTFHRIYFCSIRQNLQANFDKIFYDYVCWTSSLNRGF